jgi:hypothetical protein
MRSHGVLLQEAHRDVPDRAADQVDRIEADAVHPRRDRQHHLVGHPRRPQALVAVAQGFVDDGDVSRHGAAQSGFMIVRMNCLSNHSCLHSRCHQGVSTERLRASDLSACGSRYWSAANV